MSATASPESLDPLESLRRAEQLVDAFVAGRDRRAKADAREIRLLARAMASVTKAPGASIEQGRRTEIARRSLVAELATATRLSEWTVTRMLGESADLCERFGPGVDALERGDISRHHLAVIQEAGREIRDDRARADFLTAALQRARDLTPGRLAPVVRVIAERHRERSLDERHAEANETRRVDVDDLPDNMAALTAILPATIAHGIHDRLTAQARSVVDARESQEATSEDLRTMAQLRADVLADTLLTAGPEACVAGEGLDAIRATVQITIPVLTMTGASAEPVLLAGYGPIDTETARQLAAGAPGWERVMTSPVTGDVLAVDRYRCSSALKRFLRARDERCRFPGCRMAVWRCDIDHTIDAAHGGATSSCNLAHLCRRHHVLKHVSPWTVEQVSPGVLVWTSPSGRKHTDRPEPSVRFAPDDELLARRRVIREPWLFAAEDPPGSAVPAPF